MHKKERKRKKSHIYIPSREDHLSHIVFFPSQMAPSGNELLHSKTCGTQKPVTVSDSYGGLTCLGFFLLDDLIVCIFRNTWVQSELRKGLVYSSRVPSSVASIKLACLDWKSISPTFVLFYSALPLWSVRIQSFNHRWSPYEIDFNPHVPSFLRFVLLLKARFSQHSVWVDLGKETNGKIALKWVHTHAWTLFSVHFE